MALLTRRRSLEERAWWPRRGVLPRSKRVATRPCGPHRAAGRKSRPCGGSFGRLLIRRPSSREGSVMCHVWQPPRGSRPATLRTGGKVKFSVHAPPDGPPRSLARFFRLPRCHFRDSSARPGKEKGNAGSVASALRHRYLLTGGKGAASSRLRFRFPPSSRNG